jgi:cytochrome c oxidase cbb3-type subunit 3
MTAVVVLAWHAWQRPAMLLAADPDALDRMPALAEYAREIARPAYARYCAGCHGRTREGRPDLGAPALADGHWLYGSGLTWELERTIAYGIRSGDSRAWNLAEMPAFARARPSSTYQVPPLRPEDITDVVAYVRSLSGPVEDASATQRGARIFTHEGACVDCHSADAKGDSAVGAPDLTDAKWIYGDASAASIRRSVAYGRRGVCPAWAQRLPPATIRALAFFVHDQARSVGP